MPRKSHRKSRLGCVECKRRHLKCDETKPKCINCITAHIRCPYEADRRLSRNHLTTPESLQDGQTSASNPSSVSSPAVDSSTISAPSPSVSNSTELNILHLELLHWWTSGSYRSFLISPGSPTLYENTCIKHGLQHHFLMRQILATSALHLSVIRPEKRAYYHHHATQLQAEALAEYNVVLGKLDENNILSAFLFSSLTGLHVFCDTFTSGERDFTHVLDSLVSCINLLRGVRAVIGPWWEFLLKSELRPILMVASELRQAGQDNPYQLDDLTELIAEADIGQVSKEVYERTISELQQVFTVQASVEPNSSESANMIFAWLVTVPKEFVDLLSARRPEALIIFSYYAILLRQRRNFWAIGDAGKLLIDGISSHLGKHWDKWLAWPKSVMTA